MTGEEKPAQGGPSALLCTRYFSCQLGKHFHALHQAPHGRRFFMLCVLPGLATSSFNDSTFFDRYYYLLTFGLVAHFCPRISIV
jgi:hypothetical protein